MAAERERFERAAEFMRNATSLRLSNDQKLQLYGYFKQVCWSTHRFCTHWHVVCIPTLCCRLMRESVTGPNPGSLILLDEQNGVGV